MSVWPEPSFQELPLAVARPTRALVGLAAGVYWVITGLGNPVFLVTQGKVNHTGSMKRPMILRLWGRLSILRS